MRIAFICTDKGPCPPIRGGAIQLLISRVAPLLAAKHHVSVFSIADPELPAAEILEGVKYERYSQNSFFFDVCKKIEEKPFDVIQVFNRPAWIPDLRAICPDAVIILSLHNEYQTLKTDPSKAEEGLREADQILTVSHFVAKELISKRPHVKDKVQVLYTGVDLKEYAPVWSKRGKRWRQEIRKHYKIGDKDPVLLFVGRLVPYKGAHLVVSAMKTILKSHQNAKLLIVGSKWYGDNSKNKYINNLRKNARSIEKNVIFTSYVSVDEIPKYFAAADLFICASQWKEPLARVHYEAMAAGLPIITTRRGGNHEVIVQDKNGFVINDYKNPAQFAKTSMKLLSDKVRLKKMGVYGRHLVQNYYNVKRVAADLDSIYKSLE